MPPQFILPKGNRERALPLAHTVLAGLDETVAWRVTIEPVKSTRTLSQNAYLFGVCYKMISEVTGYELQEVHEYCLGAHFGWVDKKVPKRPSNRHGTYSVPRRSTTINEAGKRSVLSKKDFSTYVDFVQRFAAEKLSLVLPDPDPSLRIR
jgi:hypothetical protein